MISKKIEKQLSHRGLNESIDSNTNSSVVDVEIDVEKFKNIK